MTDEQKTSREPHVQFVSFLLGLAAREDRGALAALRRGLGKEREPPAEMLRLVFRHLPPERPWEHHWYYTVAALFGLYPHSGGRGNLGDTFRRLGDHESAQKRFIALLDAHPDDLPYRLRQAIALAKSHDAPVNWFQLLEDLLHWRTEDRRVQQKWAQAYWAPQKASTENEARDVSPAAADAEKGA